MTSRKDFLGNVIDIGDSVAFMTPNYRCMVLGTIIAFTPQKIRIKYLNTWNYGSQGLEKEFLANPDQVIKKD